MPRYWGSNYGGYIQAFMDVSHSQNIAANQTTVYMNGYIDITNGGSISDYNTLSTAAINGSYVYYDGPRYMAFGVGTHHISSGSLTITHNPDGTLGGFNVSHAINWSFLGISVGTSITYSVERIPRGPRVLYNGTWRNTVAYVNQSGTWKIAIPYVNQSGTWKIGGG